MPGNAAAGVIGCSSRLPALVGRLSARKSLAAPFSAAVFLLSIVAEDAAASGVALREQSASAIGNALAGSLAGADDLSYMFFNPAGITRLEGNQALAVMSVLMPHVEFREASATTATGVPLSGSNGGKDVVPDSIVPAFYALWDVQQTFNLDQNIKAGLAVNVPFALESDYADGWVGRYYALQSRLRTFNANPVIAYEIRKGLSVAAGLQVQYAEARLTNAIDFGSIAAQGRLAPLARPGQQDGKASIDGDDIGYGYTLGLMYEPWQGTRFGASFRSAIDHTLKGNADFNLGSSGIGQRISTASGAFVDTKARAQLTTPWTASFGFQQAITDEWSIMGTIERAGWSSFDELRIKYQNPHQPNTVTETDWNDSWFGAVGLTWRPTEAWAFRGGFAYDQSPIPNDKRSPRIPIDDRAWLALGAAYRPLPAVAVDLSYAHLFASDASIDLSAVQSGNRYNGSLSSVVEAAIDIFSLQARIAF